MREITDLDEIKKIELEIMKKIHQFCEENKIEYFLSYGSLIGAIRHKGFIPWDDDIDIFMARPEYEKFLKLFPKYEEKLNLKLVNHKTVPYYGRNLSKVIDTNTVLYEPVYKSDDPIGVFVDIWPLDGVPNNRIIRWWHIKKANFLKKLILASSMKKNDAYSMGKNICITIANLFNSKKLVLYMERIAKQYLYEKSDYVKCYPAKHVLYKKTNFNKRVEVKFEDSIFYAPIGYDKILRDEYGDYMNLPPKDQQIPHHVINTFYKE